MGIAIYNTNEIIKGLQNPTWVCPPCISTEKADLLDQMVKDSGNIVCEARLEIFERLISAGWVKS